MIRLYRALAMTAAFVFAFTGGGATMVQAAPVTASSIAQANDAKAAVGDRWQEILATGELVTMERVAPGVSKTVTAVAMSIQQCTGHPYFCMWSGQNYTGTYWRYNMNNVYSNTANGVAHCWNLAPDANNNTRAWLNASNDRSAELYNWINCNESGESLDFGHSHGVTTGGTCQEFGTRQNWCTTLHPTSLRASA